LNSIVWTRCLGMGLIPQRPGTLVNPKTSSVRPQGRTPTNGEDHSGTDNGPTVRSSG
jgi:hypothetical protein